MKRGKWPLIGIVVTLVVVLDIAIFVAIRILNPQQVQHQRYQQWHSAYVQKRGADGAFVNAGTAARPLALSEAQGYGLWITTLAGARGWANEGDFTALLHYYQKHQTSPTKEGAPTHLMQWRQYRDHKGRWVSDASSATDGDLYIAAALGRAARVWPRHAATYRQQQAQVAGDILDYEYNPQTGCLTTGDWVRLDSPAAKLLRTSDVMPTVFDQLARETGDRRWAKVKDRMLDRLNDLSGQHRTGLVPDFAIVSKTGARPTRANLIAGPHDGDYGPNACRVPLMLAHSRDARAERIEQKMLKFFSAQPYVAGGYTLAGRPLVKHQSASYSAPLFAAVNQRRGQGYDQLFTGQKYVFSRRLPQHEYYGATLTTMVALEGW